MEIKPCKYAVFWEPQEPISGFIAGWKDLVTEAEPDAVYLHHPVHCTFFVWLADERSEQSIIHTLEKACKGITTFPIAFSGWLVFRNDAATGGNTYTVGIQPSASLFKCQWEIASEMVVYKTAALSYPVDWKGAYQRSMDQFGFPFVGEHWLPHISIASVKQGGNQVLEAAERATIPVSEVVLTSLSLYKITGDEHLHLKTFQLTE